MKFRIKVVLWYKRLYFFMYIMFKSKIKSDIIRIEELLNVEPIENKDVIRLIRLKLHLIQYLHSIGDDEDDSI